MVWYATVVRSRMRSVVVASWKDRQDETRIVGGVYPSPVRPLVPDSFIPGLDYLPWSIFARHSLFIRLEKSTTLLMSIGQGAGTIHIYIHV
jgi:hypothetical protein